MYILDLVRWESPVDASDTAAGIPFRKLRQGRPSVSFQTVTLLVVETIVGVVHRCGVAAAPRTEVRSQTPPFGALPSQRIDVADEWGAARP